MAKKSRINICAVLGLCMILVGGLYVVVCTILGLYNRWAYRLIFAVWVLLYVLLTDYIEPVATNKLRRKNKKQVKAYYRYAILDTVGVVGLLWFVVMAGMLNDYTHYAGIAIFVACFVPKQTFHKIYNMRQSRFEELEELDDEDEFDYDDIDLDL